MLIIDKPHKFRCNYYAPFPLVIVGGSNYVSVYDYENDLNESKRNIRILNSLYVDQLETQFKNLMAN